METVVIEISTVFKDRTKAGMGTTISGYDKLSKSIQKTKDQTDKASKSMGTLADKIKSVAGKVVSIPVKIIDYATSPLRKLYNFATSLKGVLTGLAIGQTFSKAISTPLSIADQYTSAKIGFETLFRSAEKAQKMMNDIDRFAIETPFNTSNVISNIQKMMAYGWDTSRLLSDMKIIGDAAAATGKGDEGLGSIVYALSEIRSKGKLSTAELNQLASAGIKAKAYLAEGLGYGTSDEGMMKLAADIEKGVIGANQAVDLILEGMKEFEGMMDKTANETVSGLKSQLADMFEVNIARRWGQGLQDGAKRGFGTISTLLDENREKLAAFGDTMYELGADVSNFLADRLEIVIKDLDELTRSSAFQNADLFGKAKLIWDKIIAEPFNEWWNGEGGTAFKQKATQIGESIGEAIANGVMKVFGQIIPNMLKSAGKLLPGGESADGSAVASGLGLLWLGKSMGLGKLAGWSGSKLLGMLGSGGAGAAGIAGLSATGLIGTAGAATAAVGLLGAVNDLSEASESVNKKTKRDYQFKAGTKVGMIGAGAAIGSLFGPLGALLGAGAGGLVSLLAGGAVGEWVSDLTDGTAAMHNLGSAAAGAQEKLNKAIADANNFSTIVGDWKDARYTFELVNETEETTEQRIKDTKEMIDAIQSKQATLTLNLAGATEEERKQILDLMALNDTHTIMLNYTLSGELNDVDKDFLNLAIAAYEEQKAAAQEAGADKLSIDTIDLHIKTMKYVIDGVDEQNIKDAIADLENAEENIVDLKTRLDDPTLTDQERTRMEAQLQTAEADYLTLKALVAGIENKQQFYDDLEEMARKLEESSGGMITAWEAMFSPLDVIAEKLERIQELKDKAVERSRSELMVIVNNGRDTHKGIGEKIQEYDDLATAERAMAGKYNDAAVAYDKFMSDYQLINGEFIDAEDDLNFRHTNGMISDEEWKRENDKIEKEYVEKTRALFKELFESGNWDLLLELADKETKKYLENAKKGADKKSATSESLHRLMTTLGLGVGGYYGDKASAYSQSAIDYDALREEKQTAYDQYVNAVIELIKTDKNKYGMTFDDYIQKISAGDYSGENALDITPFIQMINDVLAAEAENPLLSEGYKLSMANIAGQIVEGLSEDIAKSFKGAEIADPVTFADYLNNALVYARNTLLGDESIADPITDVSEALAGVGIVFTDVTNKAKTDLTTATANVANASGNISNNLGYAASAAGRFASRVNALGFGGITKHATGTITNGPEIAEIGEDGTEFVIPVSSKYRSRGLALWRKAGQMLGVRQYAAGGAVGRQYVDVGAAESAPQAVSVDVGGVKFEVVVQGGDSQTVLNTIRENIHALADEVAGEIGRAIPRVYANTAT